MSMYLLHRLPGQRADPTSSPAEHSGTEQRTEESWDGILKASTHHADSGEDKTAETNDSTRIYRESFKTSHQRLCAGEVHRSLGMSNTGECESDQSRTHHARCVE